MASTDKLFPVSCREELYRSCGLPRQVALRCFESVSARRALSSLQRCHCHDNSPTDQRELMSGLRRSRLN